MTLLVELVVEAAWEGEEVNWGSGNILMAPNDQYLCIVPDRAGGASASDLVLPFEGDAGLSVIVSRALLLAADAKIRDATILRQIRTA